MNMIKLPSQTVVTLFEAQVLRTPHEIAIIYENRCLSYLELNSYANQLAHYLIANLTLGKDHVVALCLLRNQHLLITILACFKAGIAYVALDPDWPMLRVEHILAECKVKTILTNQEWESKLEQLTSSKADSPLNFPGQIIIDGYDTLAKVAKHSSSNLNRTISSDSLAYIIYTSGSTGTPKGLMIEHGALTNGILDIINHHHFMVGSKVLSQTTYLYDPFMRETLVPLLCGSQLHLISAKLDRDIKTLLEQIKYNDIDLMVFVPSYLMVVLTSEAFQQYKDCFNNKTIFLCGEKFPDEKILQLVKQYNLTIVHQYGVSELSQVLFEIKYDLNKEPVLRHSQNNFCFILDSELNQVAIGETGELYIGGASLARGYINQERLTREKFIGNPFVDKNSTTAKSATLRLYKTGDLATYTPDGKIKLIGRQDFQVKLNGVRIELGEIESQLITYPGINQAAVLLKKRTASNWQENGYLAAYYIADQQINEITIINHLATTLPRHMLPATLTRMEQFPLTANGKLDRQTLAMMDDGINAEYIPPQTELESKVIAICARVLGLELTAPLSMESSFFKLGGSSILAIKLVSDLNSNFLCEIKISDFFTATTIRDIVTKVKATIGEFSYQHYLIKDCDLNNLYQPFAMNNVQQAYYLGRMDGFELNNIATHSYSELVFTNLNQPRLEHALNQLILRHPGLRTIYINGQQQYLAMPPKYSISYYEYSKEEELLTIRERLSHKVYVPDQFPLFDVIIGKYNDKYILHFGCDDLLLDWNSSQIFFRELTLFYNTPNISLPSLKVTFRDYLDKLHQIRQSQLFKVAKDYWLNKLEQYDFSCNLPLLTQPQELTSQRFKRISRAIPFALWNKLTLQAREHNIGITSVLLTIFAKVLCYWSNQTQICINLTLFNRLPLHPQINEIIGNFTNLELFAYQDKASSVIITEFSEVHQQLWADIDHNLFDGVDLQRVLRKQLASSSQQILAPIVLTSMLGNGTKYGETAIDTSYQGTQYAISQTSQVWLDNKAYEDKNGFVAEWDYVEQLFAENTINLMHEHYCSLIEELAELDWNQAIFPELTISSEDQQLINKANQVIATVPEATLVSYYEKQVKENNYGQNIAVIDYLNGQVRKFSYQQLMNDSEKLAKYLISQSSAEDCLIAILSEKGYNQVVATSAIMKAGCGYLPLNQDWPILRQQEVLNSGQISLILVSRAHYTEYLTNEQLGAHYQLLVIEDILENPQLATTVNNTSLPTVSSNDIAYVIFTSGSTGKPKGVTINHRSALNTIIAVNDTYSLTMQDKVLALSELSFDLSVYDIYGLLAVGGTIVMPNPKQTKDPGHWVELIEQNQVSIWNSVPQLASLLVTRLNTRYKPQYQIKQSPDDYSGIRLFLLSGDWVSRELPEQIWDQYSETTIVSLGGATEGSIWSIWHPITLTKTAKIPYGQAMPNQKIYVLNQQLKQIPVGVIGEIYIGGVGVAVNYWNDQEKTDSSFIQHHEFGRIYKTGDLGLWHADGYVEFMGRKDSQVKINGYRVELQEIDACLKRINGVNNSLTIIHQQKQRNYLLSYLIPEHDYIDPKERQMRDAFRLLTHGINNELTVSYSLPVKVNESEFLLRKSYRSFATGQNVDTNLIKDELATIINQLPEFYPATMNGSQSLGYTDLIMLLSKLSCLTLSNRTLPKYLYPSAGSSYGIRCYLNIDSPIGEINPGHYYYNPSQHGLAASTNLLPILQMNQSWGTSLDLVIYWPAITSLYKHQAQQFAYLEVGHILALLIKVLHSQDINYRLELHQADLSNDESLLARVIFNDSKTNSVITQNESAKSFSNSLNNLINLYSRQDSSYHSLKGTKSVELAQQDIFVAADSYSGAILESGSVLITLDDLVPDYETLVSCGMLFQWLGDNLYKHNLGSCMLGYRIYPECQYAMVIGPINEVDKNSAESNPKIIGLTGKINQELAKYLPEYMLPQEYILIRDFPLNTNGKVDRKQLPRPTLLTTNTNHLAPSTEIEAQIYAIFGRILGLDDQDYGVTDDFFQLGGNSLLAIQAIELINTRLNAQIKLIDLYQLKTVEQLAARSHENKADLSEIETL